MNSMTSTDNSTTTRLRFTLTELLDRVDTDVLLHLDSAEVRAALNAEEPPVTYEALTEALCLGDAASEHPAADVLDVWHSFHRDVALMIGARVGAAMATGAPGPHLVDYEDCWRQAADYHADVLKRRSRMGALLPSPAEDQRNCDGWCNAPHDSKQDGFHHDGAKTNLPLGESGGGDAGTVTVGLSRWAADQEDEPGRHDPVMVDVDWPENRGMSDHTQLELDEAERLARSLLLKVADARRG